MKKKRKLKAFHFRQSKYLFTQQIMVQNRKVPLSYTSVQDLLDRKRDMCHLFDSTFLSALEKFACSSQLCTMFEIISKACHTASNILIPWHARTFSCKDTSHPDRALPVILIFAEGKAVSLFPHDTT